MTRNRSTPGGDRGTDIRNHLVGRRAVLATTGIVGVAGLAGCIGRGAEDSTDDEFELEPPWTTEELADHVEDGTEVTIYNGYQDAAPYEQLIDVINDEYGTDLVPDVYATDGGEVSQRIMQERQAGSDRADVISVASDIMDLIHVEGPDAEGEYFELGVDENYWFSDELPAEYTERWYASLFNGGPSIVMAINPEVLDEQGLPYPECWNALFDDQYEGVTTLLSRYVPQRHIGWIVDHHAEQQGMDGIEWLEGLLDHLDVTGTDSFSSGTREVGEGKAPLTFFNFPWVVSRFTDDFPVEIHVPETVPRFMSSSTFSVNSEAPNPWAARFVLSATAEEAVQRRMIHDVDDFVPGRLDLDYSDEALDPHTEALLSTDVERISFWDELEFVEVGREATQEVLGR